MGTVITNLDNIVTTAIGDQISTHVNIVAANQAITDANAAVITAANKAGVATAQAAIATSKAAEADASADAAGASEIAAATSASEAQAERLLALDYRNDAFDYLNATMLKYDEFDDRYLGAYDDDPLTDNDGRALIEGALYWHMIDKSIKVYTGSIWKNIADASGALIAALNLSDIPNKVTARDNLGVYSKAYIDVVTDQAYTFDGNKEFSGNVTVQGDLVVNGATTTVDAENVTIKDNILTLNAGETGAGVTLGSSGILIDRGTATDYEFKFDEADDSFKIGQVGDLQKVATREDTPVDGSYARWDAATGKFVTIDIATVAMAMTNKTADDISNKIGADHVHYKVRNNSGVTINKGTVVTAASAQPSTDYVVVVPVTDSQTQVAIGIVHTTLANNAVGLVLNTGVGADIDTSAWPVGTILYPNSTGGFTSTKPTSGMYQACAYVLRQHATQGTLLCEFTEPTYIGSTTQSGYVQLEDTLTSTSTVKALTAAQGKVLQDTKEPANANIQTHIATIGNPHGTVAGEVGVTPNGNLSSTEVQSALVELQGDIDSLLVDIEW